MRKIIFSLFAGVIIFASCNKNPIPEGTDFRQEMRDFVIELSEYSKSYDNSFIVIPQNGQELITDTGEGDGNIYSDYVQAIDATGRESMFYGYYNDDEVTPDEDMQHLLDLCLVCEQENIKVLATDYCSTQSKMDNSYLLNNQNGFISFAADQRNLNNIPIYPTSIYNENSNDILTIADAKNFLYIINSENYDTKQDFITDVSATNYDVIIMDLYHNENIFTNAELEQLKIKQNGGSRLVICYMSIGEAEDYRYYWQSNWRQGNPLWLEKENPDWKGNFKVRYWHDDWKSIIYGNDDSYVKKIINIGFDGVYLDIIDAFEFYEEL